MKQRRKKPHEKGLAIHSAPSFALGIARYTTKRKQGNRWGGYNAIHEPEAHYFFQFDFPTLLQGVKSQLYSPHSGWDVTELPLVDVADFSCPDKLNKPVFIDGLSSQALAPRVTSDRSHC